MKEKILSLLNEKTYVSGEEISQQLGVSRTAIWKQMKALVAEGYTFDAVTRKGYRIVSRPDTLKSYDIWPYLTTSFLGRHIHDYEVVSSTQFVAHEYANKEAPEGTLIVADAQQQGRGRLARPWQSKQGVGISMSLLLRPQIEPQRAPQLTLLAAVAVVRAIEQVSGLSCDIKWPNDILYKGKKLVGILTEMAADPDWVKYVIVGMGVNCHHEREDFADGLADVATSIQLETGKRISRANLVAATINEFEWLYEAYVEEGFMAIKPLWEARAISLHTYVHVRTSRETLHGYALGITDDGRLRVRDEGGDIHLVYSADIELDTTR
ncbi:biotin--[acetyl-CoA-carboxylase] ligase [Shouchella lonarensis]|uniref:Bifunctional ligase/repressor BirA n=1 Tax=Shouchella lonarensis TaxID=1464122 RepID=A0A1G6HAC3_9BACI|nr:biotin--[acetyl-CoA-carboxylase] ligase [Shouchella lonarensis]SDB91103.1 BirA family transcriptional regulator, biotin operon repressor / biotin-[acetyl-CoA-carboxylase] ligase [Shouchella lonarensis]